ncbi:MAG: DUF1801 domain-containing protein [Chloroflexi bacterium]|nr:MAG: DUF1801 domain-containing protein [Chloroflexota bacterium]
MARAGRSTSISTTRKSADVDAYIAAAPRTVQPKLRQLRTAIKAAAPKATEKISYGIPFYDYKGRLIYFAIHTTHIGMYPSGDAKGLEKYLTEKATLRFPLDEPLPLERIRKLIADRVKERDAGKVTQMVPAARRSAKTR